MPRHTLYQDSSQDSIPRLEHFSSSKALVIAPATLAAKHKSDPPREPIPRRVAPSSSGAGSKKRKEKSTRLKKRKAQEVLAKARNDDGGFTLTARGKVRKLGINVPVGNEYTCLPDALHTLIEYLAPKMAIKQKEVRAALTRSDGKDPDVSMAMEYVDQHKMKLRFRRELSSPASLFSTRGGTFLVRLRIVSDEDEDPDHHFVAYLAEPGFVVDNHRRQPVPTIDDKDRTSNQEAIKVFSSLFPGAERIQLTSVHELCPRARLPSKILVPTTTRSRPPTLDDLFVELYMDELISYHELLRSTVNILPPVANLD